MNRIFLLITLFLLIPGCLQSGKTSYRYESTSNLRYLDQCNYNKTMLERENCKKKIINKYYDKLFSRLQPNTNWPNSRDNQKTTSKIIKHNDYNRSR
jgi:hypothetical protein